MDIIYNFLADYYIIFAIISVFFFFALIGILSSNPDKLKNNNTNTQPIIMDNYVENNSYSMDNMNNSVNTSSTSIPSIASPEIFNNDSSGNTFIEPSLESLENKTDNLKIDVPNVENNNMFVINDSNSITQNQENNELNEKEIEAPNDNNSDDAVQLSGGLYVIEDTDSSSDDTFDNVPTSKKNRLLSTTESDLENNQNNNNSLQVNEILDLSSNNNIVNTTNNINQSNNIIDLPVTNITSNENTDMNKPVSEALDLSNINNDSNNNISEVLDLTPQTNDINTNETNKNSFVIEELDLNSNKTDSTKKSIFEE